MAELFENLLFCQMQIFMILHYILHQFCIPQNCWLPGVLGYFLDLALFCNVLHCKLAYNMISS